MYTLSQIRRRVDALKRKYAADITVIKLRPLAEEYCLLWAEALSDGNAPPESYAFIRHIARHGFRLNTFTALHLYLKRCREGGRNPNPIGIIASLLPEVSPSRLEQLLLNDDADRQEPAPYPAHWRPSWLRNPHAVTRLLGGLHNLHSGESRNPAAAMKLPGSISSLLARRARRHGARLSLAHCHPLPTSAKLPPISQIRNAIRHPLRC